MLRFLLLAWAPHGHLRRSPRRWQPLEVAARTDAHRRRTGARGLVSTSLGSCLARLRGIPTVLVLLGSLAGCFSPPAFVDGQVDGGRDAVSGDDVPTVPDGWLPDAEGDAVPGADAPGQPDSPGPADALTDAVGEDGTLVSDTGRGGHVDVAPDSGETSLDVVHDSTVTADADLWSSPGDADDADAGDVFLDAWGAQDAADAAGNATDTGAPDLDTWEPCPPECSAPDAVQCTPEGLRTCVDEAGCLVWSAPMSCDDGDPCTSSGCAEDDLSECDGTIWGGACYRAFAGDPLTGAQAREACEAWSGHLATISEASENVTVAAVSLADCPGSSDAWIGLSTTAGAWTWDTGEPVGYVGWGGAAPAAVAGARAVIQPGSGSWAAGAATSDCHVCERPMVAEGCYAVPISCDDGDPCTADECSMGGCAHSQVQCDDGDDCNGVETCGPGGCVSGTPVECTDPTPCVWSDCIGGACHLSSAPYGLPCDDGDACTEQSLCDDRVCRPVPFGGVADCDDGLACTTDSCSPSAGCVHVDTCSDGDPCTTNSCGAGGECAIAPATGPECDDGDPCTTGSTCVGGSCLGTGQATCDDFDVCTDDFCTAGKGCEHTDNNAWCDDGDACTTDDLCGGGTCAGSFPVVCNDGNPCTQDSCAAESGCVYVPAAGACSDGDSCTDDDHCIGKFCYGTPRDCDDGDICTTDSCDPVADCVHVKNSVGCDDGNPCTATDTCSNGVCVGSGALNCDDGNPCTTDNCSVSNGCSYTNNVLPCNDNNACTQSDKCKNGECVGTPVVCGVSDSCTVNHCDSAIGCLPSTKAYCCQAPNSPDNCNRSYVAVLGTTGALASYNEGTCGQGAYDGGELQHCFQDDSNKVQELCVDFDGPADGGAFILKDTGDTGGVPSDCVTKVAPGTCAMVPTIGPDETFAHYLAVLDAPLGGATVRYHVRCLPTTQQSCNPVGTSLTDSVPRACTNANWVSNSGEDAYGGACGGAAVRKYHLFTFDAPSPGTYSVWLGSSAEDQSMVLYAGKRVGSTCSLTDCSVVGAVGHAIHFTTTTWNEKWCVWADSPAEVVGPTISYSEYE